MTKQFGKRHRHSVAHKIRYHTTLATVVLVVNVLSVSVGLAEEPDWTTYEKILQTYVKPGIANGVTLNLVDYAELKRDPAFSIALESLAEFPVAHLDSVAERIAFYINAYNILAISVVVDQWPVASIRDVGNIFRSVWKRKAGVIDGESITLNEIEHDILRAFGDPRIHFAIVCASISYPDLHIAAYRAEGLDEQLNAQTKAFLHNPKKGISIETERVRVSKIFEWFRDDFASTGGVESFVRRYRELAKQTIISPSLDYDWSVNTQ